MTLTRRQLNTLAAGIVPLAVISIAAVPASGQTDAAERMREIATAPSVDLAALGVFEQVYFQTTSDGVLHAKGSNYKAMFTGPHMIYHPRNGKPMTFAVASATVGGHPLPLNTETLATCDGDIVSIDRGSFIEKYALTHNTIEQLFVIDQLPANGDLVVRIAVDSPGMTALTKTDGLAFKSEQMEVTYSKAVLVDDVGTRTGLSTQIDNGVIEIRVNSSTLNRAAYPITIDPMIGNSDTFGYFSYSYKNPDLAYDATSNRFVLVAEFDYSETDRDVYCLLLDGDGDPIPNTFDYVDLTGVTWRNPKVANNNIANTFMVVAEHGLDGQRGIWGSTIDPATGDTGPQFIVDAYDLREKTNPDIGGDSLMTPPTHFLVVWQHAFSSEDHDIYARLMNADGTPVDDTFVLDGAVTSQSHPAISKSNRGSQWVVAWQTKVTNTNHDIWAARVNWNGTVTIPAMPMNESTDAHSKPQVSSPMAGRFLLVYQNGLLGGQPQLQLLSSNLTTLDSKSLLELGNDVFGMPRRHPTVDADGSKFVVGYVEKWDGQYWYEDLYADTICVENDQLRLAEFHKYLAFTGSGIGQMVGASAWSAGGVIGGPAVFAWNEISGGEMGEIRVAGYEAPISCCPADIAPVGGDGVIGVPDLLAVINDWDNTGWCFSCAGDITSDFYVNVPDLLQVINAWGQCD